MFMCMYIYTNAIRTARVMCSAVTHVPITNYLMGVCTKKNCKYPLIAVIACCVCHVVCMMPDLLDPGFDYWTDISTYYMFTILLAHGCPRDTSRCYIFTVLWHMVAQGYINVHRSVGTWLPEKLFMETYQ